jgi:hypothetical protein
VLPANWQRSIAHSISIVAAASISMTASSLAAADSAAPVAVNNPPIVQPVAPPATQAADPAAVAPAANSADPNQANAAPLDIGGPVILGDGFVYQGGLRDGLPNGRGIKRWPTGEWVVGNFVKGKLDGEATIHNSEGGTLSGMFKNNAPWDAVEKTADGNVVAQYNGGVMRPVTQAAAPASATQGAQPPTVQQVHSSADVPKQ